MKPFDERLFQLKMLPINQRMHGDAGKCWARARAKVQRLGNHAALLPTFVECQLEVLRNYLEEVYKLHRKVWLLDGNTVTPEFIRNIVVPHVFTVIAARKGAIQHELDLHAMRTGEHQRDGHIGVHEMNRLQGELANRYEIEAIELAKPGSQSRRVTQSSAARPLRGMWLEDAGPRTSMSETSETRVSYSKFRRSTLQRLLDEVEARLRYLKERFPDWRAWASRYGPGNELPAYYVEIDGLEKDRESIVLELSKRVKPQASSRSQNERTCPQ